MVPQSLVLSKKMLAFFVARLNFYPLQQTKVADFLPKEIDRKTWKQDNDEKPAKIRDVKSSPFFLAWV